MEALPKDPLLARLLEKVARRYPDHAVLATFRVLWDGWELDNRGAVIRVGTEIKLMTTNHGTLITEDPEFLRERIKEHEAVLGELRRALEAMGGQ